jgi:hypothetical protein
LLFLLPLDFFSPPWLLRLLLPLARSLCALLFCELALPPLLAASARLPLLRLDDDDDLELRGAIDISLVMFCGKRTMRLATRLTLGLTFSLSVGCVCASV